MVDVTDAAVEATERPEPDLEDVKMSDVMTAKQLAEILTGREYRSETTTEERNAAANAGLVIVFGAGDDLMEFEGAINDEVGSWKGATVTVDPTGIQADWDGIDSADRRDIEFMRDYFRREGGGRTIEALWAKEGDYSWTFKTDLPHETFEIVEDGAPYCRGIVFALADCVAAKDAMKDAESFQVRVDTWIQHCFGPKIGADRIERNHRFIEEALELVQSGGCTASEAHQLVDYVFGRPVGEMRQEVGGVMNTLAALCTAYSVDLNDAAEAELARVWVKSDQIRAKQAAKPKHSPLPEGGPTNG
jgi:hypothetical protein